MPTKHASMDLPQPIIPALKSLTLLKAQTALVTAPTPVSAAQSLFRSAWPAARM